MLKEDIASILTTDNDSLVDTMEQAYRESVERNCIMNVTMYDDGEVEAWQATDVNECKRAEFDGTAFRIASFNNEYFECEIDDNIYLVDLELDTDQKKAAEKSIAAGEYSDIDEYMHYNNENLYHAAREYYKQCYLDEYARETAIDTIDRATQRIQENFLRL